MTDEDLQDVVELVVRIEDLIVGKPVDLATYVLAGLLAEQCSANHIPLHKVQSLVERLYITCDDCAKIPPS